ncbi:MAG: single-stranded DNA-binding protein [Anaerolineae bacterium]|nr:single-stranded DNA-binding protein [Anaerolineae bacterium]
MRTLQVTYLIGRLGRDPDMRYTPEGHVVTKFSVATDRPTKPGAEPETDWHQVVCWGPLAEFAGQYLGKGRLVYIAGRITYRSWDGKDGQKRYATEIVASEVIALDRRPDNPSNETAADEPVF